MAIQQAFQESYTVPVAAGTTATSVALPSAEGDALLIFNASASVAHLSLTGPATTGNLPIPPGGSRLITVGYLALTASVLIESGTGNVYLSRGNGSTY
jgi:hypothetical protein